MLVRTESYSYTSGSVKGCHQDPREQGHVRETSGQHLWLPDHTSKARHFKHLVWDINIGDLTSKGFLWGIPEWLGVGMGDGIRQTLRRLKQTMDLIAIDVFMSVHWLWQKQRSCKLLQSTSGTDTTSVGYIVTVYANIATFVNKNWSEMETLKTTWL